MRAYCSAPTWACSIISFSPPSCIGGKHLNAQAPVGRGVELLADLLDRLDGRIAERVHVGSLEHHAWPELALHRSRGRRQHQLPQRWHRAAAHRDDRYTDDPLKLSFDASPAGTMRPAQNHFLPSATE
ncbi:MAG: hypothetical protein QM811_21175 [Pirellulales bacterium]